MFLRSKKRSKDGKAHRYFSVAENRRVRSGRVVRQQVLFLGEINDCQQASRRQTLEVFDEAEQRAATLSLFPDDREIPADALDGMRVKLREMELRRPRAFGKYWLGRELWRQLGLDSFWDARLGELRENFTLLEATLVRVRALFQAEATTNRARYRRGYCFDEPHDQFRDGNVPALMEPLEVAREPMPPRPARCTSITIGAIRPVTKVTR